ncbi:TPA: hypothetical protein L3709_006149 [Pseudomonas aeruginosa]|uniref:hypothetical protein n=1 Tax=Pseudomonas aeruginosa TaxID=287 RepID=UPI000F534116|nr:hypothetical protein [Pseudomonas aeruginosa]RPS58348.1 hypothetical protein IPC991_31060 [Pseudomonas aeruginosa]HBN8473952.1 hypothetical protein [Pseudomonas aeruginosa]
MRRSITMIACACLLLGGCSDPDAHSVNPLLGKNAECLELFARSNALYCDIRKDERESQVNGTPRRYSDYEVADAVYSLTVTHGDCVIDPDFVTDCSAQAGQWVRQARDKAPKR